MRSSGSVTLDSVFTDFCMAKPSTAIILKNKTQIVHQVCDNLNLPYENHTVADLAAIKAELNNVIHANGHGIPGLFRDGDLLEKDINNGNYLDFNVIARNLLRHIFHGTIINGADERHKRGLALVQQNLEDYKDPRFLIALREEMHKIFRNLSDKLVGGPDAKVEPVQLDVEDLKQYRIFQSNLLAAYPFLDPVEDEEFTLPQEIKGEGWKNVKYRVNKIDISPQTGLLSSLLEDEDRIYAYTLTPVAGSNPKAQSHLLLMGTTYPTGQGADLADLYNYYPRHSVGEAHDLTLVNRWIEQQQNKIKVTGQSKGATIAMIVAAQHPAKVEQADCLNPTGLCEATLNRLLPAWKRLPAEQKPALNVYAQTGDPVFPLENGFLPGTNIYKIIPNNFNKSKLSVFIPDFIQQAVEAHLHHFAGRMDALVLNVNTTNENKSLRREFFADIKGAVNWTVFPIKYCRYVAYLAAKKLYNKCVGNHHQQVKQVASTQSGFIASGLKKLGTFVGGLITFAIVFPIVVVVSFFSGIKIGCKALARACSSSKEEAVKGTIATVPQATVPIIASTHANVASDLNFGSGPGPAARPEPATAPSPESFASEPSPRGVPAPSLMLTGLEAMAVPFVPFVGFGH